MCGPLAADYLVPPRAGSFGYDYEIQPETPKTDGKQEQTPKQNFNREFRLGLGLDTRISLPNAVKVGGPASSTTNAPVPFVFDRRLANAAPLGRSVPLLHNTYRFSLILHISQFFELSFGLGYQSDSFIGKLSTVGARKSYVGGLIRKTAFYAVQYQKDTIFAELEGAVLLPWVLSARAKMVLGLRLSASVALGVLLKESLALARPILPDALSITDLDPSPTYQNIQDYFLRSRPFSPKLGLSVGAYFELIGFRFYLGYALSYFPDRLYPEATYYVLQNFGPGEPITYSSFGFPEVQIMHSLHLSLQYFINPQRLFRPQKRPPKREPALRSRIG